MGRIAKKLDIEKTVSISAEAFCNQLSCALSVDVGLDQSSQNVSDLRQLRSEFAGHYVINTVKISKLPDTLLRIALDREAVFNIGAKLVKIAAKEKKTLRMSDAIEAVSDLFIDSLEDAATKVDKTISISRELSSIGHIWDCPEDKLDTFVFVPFNLQTEKHSFKCGTLIYEPAEKRAAVEIKTPEKKVIKEKPQKPEIKKASPSENKAPAEKKSKKAVAKKQTPKPKVKVKTKQKPKTKATPKPIAKTKPKAKVKTDAKPKVQNKIKKSPPLCKKCHHKHWGFHSCIETETKASVSANLQLKPKKAISVTSDEPKKKTSLLKRLFAKARTNSATDSFEKVSETPVSFEEVLDQKLQEAPVSEQIVSEPELKMPERADMVLESFADQSKIEPAQNFPITEISETKPKSQQPSSEPLFSKTQTQAISQFIKQMTESAAVLPGQTVEKKEASPLQTITAGKIMQKNLIWCSGDETVEKAIQLQQQHNADYLLIGSNGIAQGIISRSDINGALSPYLKPTFSKWRRPLDDATLQIKIRWIMTRTIHTTCADTPLYRLIQQMRNFTAKCMPVIDQGKTVGIVTVFDIFGALLEPNPQQGQRQSAHHAYQFAD